MNLVKIHEPISEGNCERLWAIEQKETGRKDHLKMTRETRCIWQSVMVQEIDVNKVWENNTFYDFVII